MLQWALTFLIVAFIAALFGFVGLAGTAADIARILFFVFLVLFVFSLLYLSPGDPAVVIGGDTATAEDIARIREKLGLDRPFMVQFGTWLWAVLRGDLGISIFTNLPVSRLILQRIEPTIALTICTLVVTITVAIPMGVVAAWKAGTWIDRLVNFTIETIEGRIGFVKFQSAYFEACGLPGLTALSSGIKKAKAAGIGVILDAKRGDIGATASAYARAYLTPASAGGSGDFEADCLTVNPLMGPDTLEPFVECANRFGKGLFVLCRTSNPGAGWLQDKMTGNRLVSDRVADLIAALGANANSTSSRLNAVGAVVGATNSSNSNRLREIGAEEGIPSYLIADGSELRPEWIAGAETVGITAGASAPEVLVEDVIAALRRLGPVEVSTLPGRHETIEFRLPAELNRVA